MRLHLRNLLIATAVVAAMLLGSTRNAPLVAEPAVRPQVVPGAPLLQTGGFELSPNSQEVQASAGGTAVQISIAVINRTSAQVDNVRLELLTQRPEYNGSATLLPGANLGTIGGNGSSSSVTLRITVPAGRPVNDRNDFTLIVRDASNNERARGIYTIVVVAPTATLTTPTATDTPVTPTATDTPLCQRNGRSISDPFEPNNNLDDAREIAINTSQRQALCTVGDEDWVFFSAIKGKVYTIDVPEMDAGLDLTLELFDEDERQLAFNDDFFNRDPNAPNPNDLRPRIQSWTAPQNGLYYVRVRDAGGRGGTTTGGEREYVVALIGESYGPTPTNLVELCTDLFEQDGLPEQATLMVVNEAQPRHALCPTGDADWVKFFAKAGKRYVLFTDSRPYRPSANQNTDTSPGADTTLQLNDRDGRTLLAFNDDIVGGNTFDSLIEFNVEVDGVYFAQVKNVGDVGSQFIRYDLYFIQCLPEQTDCGRTRAAPPSAFQTPTPGDPNAPTADPNAVPTATIDPNAVPTATPDSIDATETAFFATETSIVATQTAEAGGLAQTFDEPTGTPGLASPSFDQFKQFRGPDGLINGRIQGFADPAFAALWQRTDRAVAEQRQIRSWMWGPTWLMARAEPFAEAPGGSRQVQYFEKGRMELNNPAADRLSPWFVSSGLLVQEMVAGNIQIGATQQRPHDAATLPVAGDADNFEAPTYTSFRRLLGTRSAERSGQLVAEALNRAGGTYPYRGQERPETRLTHYAEASGHNIPQVFWEYLNAQGLVWENGRYEERPLIDWVVVMGYPLSEPYWTYTTVGGMDRLVLVQLFERRVLVYTPDNPSGFAVEMGSVGKHYYDWRYGQK